MVDTQLIVRTLKVLERYLIRKNNFHLNGDNYDMILFIPSDNSFDAKFSLMVSAKCLNLFNQKEVIRDLLSFFQSELDQNDYNAISRINVIHSEDSLVKNLKFAYRFDASIIEINNLQIGGIHIDFAFYVKSLLLGKLIENRALLVEIRTENNGTQVINLGLKNIDDKFDVIYYTGKGLREIWSANLNDEQIKLARSLNSKSEDFLMEHGYLGRVAWQNIVSVK